MKTTQEYVQLLKEYKQNRGKNNFLGVKWM